MSTPLLMRFPYEFSVRIPLPALHSHRRNLKRILSEIVSLYISYIAGVNMLYLEFKYILYRSSCIIYGQDARIKSNAINVHGS
jgi:hypothetical protein